MTSTVISSEPAVEPVTVEDVKEQLTIEDQSDDQMIKRHIVTARQTLEQRSNGAFITQTLVTRLDDGFPSGFKLPRWPLQSVTSITYLDGNGDSQTLASSQYDVDANTRPGRVIPAYNVTWPTTRNTLNSVTTTYIAGHGAAKENVPSAIRDAIILLAGHLYCNRDGGGDIEEAIEFSLGLMRDYDARSVESWEFI